MIEFITRTTLGLVFLSAAVAKARDVGGFRAVITELGVSRRWSRPVALTLVLYEFALALLLLSGVRPGVAVLLAIVVLSAFAGVSAQALRTGSAIHCGCFGRRDSVIGVVTLSRAVGLILLAVVYYLAHLGRAETWWPPDLPTTTSAVTLVAATVVAGSWLSWAIELIHERRVPQPIVQTGGDTRLDDIVLD